MAIIDGEEYIELISQRRYTEILKRLLLHRKELLDEPNNNDLRSLCNNYLRAGCLDEAIEYYQQLIDATEQYRRGGDDYSELAAAYWLQAHREKGDPERAVTNLRCALKCNYGDGAKNMTPALLLYYVAVRTQDKVLLQEASDQIEAKLKTGWSQNWPAPLGRYLVGAAGEDHVEKELALQVPQRQPDERCRFDFYRGVKFLEIGDEVAANACFRSAIDQPNQKTWTTEFVLARHELSETPCPTKLPADGN